ncbi:MAG: HRDC domain-containing protein [Planctomycetales bacterium]|nr:HRDC domain-containing protein [Planctomycetales bacterium]
MDYQHIVKPEQLQEMVADMRGASLIGFDTEFVSEDTYYPHLCLVQANVDGRLYILDPLEVDVTPFWEALASPSHITICHAGREELRFCLRAAGKRPHRLFDAQIAAGLVGMEYPAAYSTLIARVVGKRLSKGETRTDWRRRPLTARQIEYANQDVAHLLPLYEALTGKLKERDRALWLDEEMESWQASVEESDSQERWRRVSGIAGLSAKQLAIVREIWRWRDQVARESDRPPRRVLRDDLVVELARRESSDPQRIRAIRGFERRNYQKAVTAIAEAIETALNLSPDEYPKQAKSARRPPLTLVGQFLSAALGSLCRELDLAPGLVGGAQDLRDLVCHQLDLGNDPTPRLATGWRAEVIGKSIDDLLHGRLLVGVADALAEQPLQFIKPPTGD